MLEIENLTHRYKAAKEPGGYKDALVDVSFRAVPGNITGLLGPNGAGKTTTMKLLFGLLRAQAGTITWRGAPVGYPERRSFGYMPESRSLYSSMRVEDQLVYFARHHGMERADAQRAVTEWLERLGVAGFARRRLESLSLGERQRVQLVAAFAHSPALAVLDEPFSGLDLLAVDIVNDTLRTAAAAGAAVVISSHQLDLVEDLCAEVTVLNHGRVALSGNLQYLREASGPSMLRLVLEPDDTEWAVGLAGVHLVGHDAAGLLFTLEPHVDPGTVIVAAQSAGRLRGVELGLPSLSELFRSAVAQR